MRYSAYNEVIILLECYFYYNRLKFIDYDLFLLIRGK